MDGTGQGFEWEREREGWRVQERKLVETRCEWDSCGDRSGIERLIQAQRERGSRGGAQQVIEHG